MKHIERIIAGALAFLACVTIYGIVAKGAWWHIGFLIIEILMAVIIFCNSESEESHE